MAKGEKIIQVFDKDGRYMSMCSMEIKNRLLKRDCAKIVGNNKIQLKINNNDRKKMRKEVIERDNRICYICGESIPENEIATIDHIVSKFRYGHDDKHNTKCSCVRCNGDKANMGLSQYIKVIKNNREKYGYINTARLQYLERLAVKYDTIG